MKTQLELTFANNRRQPTHECRRQARRNRARWWFGQMRAVVDHAIDWKPAPPAPPEQIHLELAPGKSRA